MAYENVRVEREEEGVALVRVHRPDKLNALNDATVAELSRAFAELGDDAEVLAVVLTGAEAKRPAFVAGADIAEMAEQSPLEARTRSQLGQALCNRIEQLGKPVIAAVNGFALGGGLELALACHLRLAADTAQLGLPEVTLGIIPGFGGTQRLPRLIGLGPALELIATGKPVSAQEAYRLGLVNHVFQAGELLEAARKCARTIAGNGPVAVRLALDAAQRGSSMPLDQGLAYETELFGLIASTEDMHEGLKAFLEKRPPAFRSR